MCTCCQLNCLAYSLHCYKRWLQGVTILAIVMTVVWIITMIYCYKHSLPMTYAFGGALVVQVRMSYMLYPCININCALYIHIYRVLLCSYFLRSASERSVTQLCLVQYYAHQLIYTAHQVYKIWKGIFLMFKERQGKMVSIVPIIGITEVDLKLTQRGHSQQWNFEAGGSYMQLPRKCRIQYAFPDHEMCQF